MRHPYDGLFRIVTCREGIARCSTQEKYETRQRDALLKRASDFPHLGFVTKPWDAPDGQVAFIVGGKWIVKCECGDCPLASPGWNIARCLQCGAVYQSLTWPPNREEIERALLARWTANVRTWLPTETLDALLAQNAEHLPLRVVP